MTIKVVINHEGATIILYHRRIPCYCLGGSDFPISSRGRGFPVRDTESSAPDADDEVYEDAVERQWGEASSVQGIDPDLMSARIRRDVIEEAPTEPAALSPWLIPLSAILSGPLVAAVLTLLADGDPPRGRHAVSILSVGSCAWIINTGITWTQVQVLSPSLEKSLRLAVLAVAGFALWTLYTYWMKGRRALDQSALINSAIILFVLSGLFWFGRDTSWWAFMGR